MSQRAANRRGLKAVIQSLPATINLTRRAFKKYCKIKNFRHEKSGKISVNGVHSGILKELK